MRVCFVVLLLHAAVSGPLRAQGTPPVPDSTEGPVLTLERAVAIALANAIAIRTSRMDVQVAAGGVQLNRGAFDPILALNPNINRADGTVSTTQGASSSSTGGAELATTVTGILPTSTRYSLVLNGVQRLEDPISTQSFETEYDNTLSFTVTQPLLEGFGGAAGLDQQRAAEDALSASEARHSRQVEVLVANVEAAYFFLAQREAEERLARESLDRAGELLARNQELRELERISGVDLLTSLTGVAGRRTSLTTATRLRRNAADDLVSLIYGQEAAVHLDGVTAVIRTAELDVAIPDLAPMSDAERQALDHRADVAAVRYDIQRQERLLGVSENALLPALDLSANYTTLGTNTADFLQFGLGRPGDFQSGGWKAGLSFSWALGNRRARGGANVARALTRQAELFLSSAENLARIDVRAAHRAVTFGQSAFEEAVAALDLNQQLYDAEVERYRLGLTDSFRLLQVEDQVSAAFQQQIAARYTLYAAVTQYKLAMGNVLLEQYGAARE